MTNVTEKFVITTELIQKELQSLKTKQEILTYLTGVKDFCASSMKTVRMIMKGYK